MHWGSFWIGVACAEVVTVGLWWVGMKLTDYIWAGDNRRERDG